MARLTLECRRAGPAAAGPVDPSSSLFRMGGWTLHVHHRPRDWHETPRFLVAVIGSIRRPGGAAISAAELLREGVVNQDGIDGSRIRGTGLVLAVDREAARIRVHHTLLAQPTLSHHASPDRLVLATRLSDLLDRIPDPAPDDDALLEHLVFRFVLPPRSYYRGVGQCPPGHLLTWDDGRLDTRRVVSVLDPERRFTAIEPEALTWLDSELSRVMGHLVAGASARGGTPATLLSGGLDSVLLQLWMDDHRDDADPARSCGFAVPEAASFRHETVRALTSSRRLETDHFIVNIPASEYPGLLERSIAILGRPSLFNEAWPCHLALAEAVRDHWGEDCTLFGGNAADGLHGVPELALVRRWERWRRFPPALAGLRALGPLLRLMGERVEPLAAVAGLRDERDPLRGPTSLVSLACELPLLLRCFGSRAVADVFERRRTLEAEAAGSAHGWERLQMVDLLTTGTEPSRAVAELHAHAGLDVAMFYRDEEVVRAVAAFAPDVRFFGDPGDGRPRLKPLQAALAGRRGHAGLARTAKGGTTFWQDLRHWMKDGVLCERMAGMERPGFVPADVWREVRERPGDLSWNLLVHDIWRRQLRTAPAGVLA